MLKRHQPLFIIVIVACLAALALPARAQAPLQIYPDQAVGVLSEDPGSGDRWSTSILPFGNYVGPDSGEDIFSRTYLHFPLDTVPTGATVRSAILYVYVDDFHWAESGGTVMEVYPVEQDWTPGGVNWDDMTNWPALGSGVVGTEVTPNEGWYMWDVTALVQGWLGGTPNQGLAIAAADLASTASNRAAARRLTAGDPATRPYLEVDVETASPTSTPTSPPAPTATPSSPPAPAPTAPPPLSPSPTATPAALLPMTGTWLGGAGWLLLCVGLTAGGLILLSIRRRSQPRIQQR